MFTEKDKSTFAYWFAHWCAYQMTALNHGAWKIKYLFHDIEKPWLNLILRNPKKVKELHRAHSVHHVTYKGKRRKDYEAMIIDWECSRFTKSFRERGAREEIEVKYDKGIITNTEYFILRNIICKYKIK